MEIHQPENVNYQQKPKKIIVLLKFIWRSWMIRILSIVFLLNFILGTIYSYLEHIPLYLGLYWATDTLTNTGSGLVPPNSEFSWILTTILMWIGLGITLLFVEYVYVNMLKKMRSQRMVKFENHIVLMGWNPKIRHFLNHLPGDLGGHHNYVLIADIPDRPFDLPKIVEFIRGNPEEERILIQSGIAKAQQAVIVVENDAMALLIAMTVQSISETVKISVNLQSSENMKHMARLGVEEIICDEELTGNALIKAFYHNKEEKKD